MGKVIRFDEYRGYGFVSPDAGGEDVFIHVNDIDFDKRLLSPGIQVEFVPEKGDRGLKAARVRLPEQRVAEVPTADSADGVDIVDGLCDVLSTAELIVELNEALLDQVPGLSAKQIVAVRGCLVSVARSHGWLDG